MNTSLHIPRQNQVVAEFESLALAPWRAGTITGQGAINKIEALAADFESFAAGLGYARALAGARDVRNLAETLKTSIRTGATFSGGNVTASTGDGGLIDVVLGGSAGPPPLAPTGGLGVMRAAASPSNVPWVLVVLAVVLIGRRRSS